jgi:hypothetical protein
MPLSKKIVIHDIDDSVITVGNANIIHVIKKISGAKEPPLTNHGENWSEVVKQINLLQNIVKGLPDKHEELRDQELVPTLSRAKKDAEALVENPNSRKKGFIDNFKSFCVLTSKIADVAEKVEPFITLIATLIGISLP